MMGLPCAKSIIDVTREGERGVRGGEGGTAVEIRLLFPECSRGCNGERPRVCVCMCIDSWDGVTFVCLFGCLPLCLVLRALVGTF